MSFNQSFNISLNSMQNNQYALTVVSQNIANMHVEGYHRQRVDFQTNRYTTNCDNVISTIKGMNGASIASLTGFIDESAFNNLLGANSDAQYYNTLADSLKGLEDIADDLGDNGLNSLLNDFYTAATRLEQFPTDLTVRREYINAAQNVCDKFNDISKKYDVLLQDNSENVSGDISIINGLLENLAEANKAHVKNNLGPATQSAIDGILSELSSYIDITTDKNPNGTYNLYIGEVKVVQGGDVNYTFESTVNPAATDGNVVKLSLKSTTDDTKVIDDVNASIKSGSMKARIDFLNGTNKSFTNITDMKKNLDDAANLFATKINAVQQFDDGDKNFAACLKSVNGELLLDRDTKAPMFTTTDNPTGATVDSNGDPIPPTTITAGNIRVNADMFTEPRLVAAARINLDNFGPTDPWEKAVGNSDNAVAINALQNEKFCTFGGVSCTLSQFLINNATKTGLDTANAQNKQDIHNDILNSATTDYNNLIGVNVDEELADMIRYQRAYEASARVFATVNNLIDVILNMV